MPTVHLVTRDSAEPGDCAVPEIAFLSRSLADAHALDITTATGLPHSVIEVTLAQALPAARTWYTMRVELGLTGLELWRSEERVIVFEGHPDMIESASSSWRVITRSTPSQPPSRVRMDLVGPDQQWCIRTAQALWAQASVCPAYRDALELESLFT